MEPVFKKQFGQGCGDVAAIPKQLAAQAFDHLRNRSAIIDIAGRQTTGEQLTTIIDGQVQLEAVKPTHTGLATLSISGKDVVLADPFGITDL